MSWLKHGQVNSDECFFSALTLMNAAAAFILMLMNRFVGAIFSILAIYPSSLMGSASSSAASQRTKPLLLPHPRVQIGKGQVEGIRHLLADGRPVNVFLGIPFAKAPVGELRFKKPVEVDSWHPTVLLAKKCRQRSVQMSFLHLTVAERRAGTSEDCLHLTVISPGWKSNEAQGHAVMFYIHGGGFLIDSCVKYEYRRVARSLVCHGVVVVIVQYRLGLLGFFSTGDHTCPGNFGLWDQLAALLWTRENIGAFGGDPSRITVFGQSAGAASADLLALSPLARDLFGQAILMGGNAECTWAVLAKQHIVPYCRRWAMKMGFVSQQPPDAEWSAEENARMMAFLRELPAWKFEVNLLGVVREVFNTMRLPLGPVVDGELIPCSPKQLRSLQCPPKRLIAGNCRHEGLLFLALGMKRADAKLLAKFEQQMKQFMEVAGDSKVTECDVDNDPSESLAISTVTLNGLYGISDAMRTDRQAVAKVCVKLLSDFMANFPLHNLCDHSLHCSSGQSTVFRYLFDHSNADNTRALNLFMPFKGATHATELAFVFDINMFVLPWRRNAEDKQVLALVTKLWTNFARFGDPNGINIKANNGEMMVTDDVVEAHQLSSPLDFQWLPIDQANVGRHLSIGSAGSKLLETDEADGQRMERLAGIYRLQVQ